MSREGDGDATMQVLNDNVEPPQVKDHPREDDAILSVRNLTTEFGPKTTPVRVVNDVSFELFAGETIAVVGESGSGKSVTMLSILGLLPRSGRVVAGQARLDERDLLSMTEKQRRDLRGKDLAVVFQDPITALNPVMRVGRQIVEGIRTHNPQISRAAARVRAVELLRLVGIPDPGRRAAAYPHELSGGMRQRVTIAMAIANGPRILIADEPTTALDVTVQAQILAVLDDARRTTHASLILITHDLGLAAELADRVLVMYAGRVVESATIAQLFDQPRHPYTVGLLASRPTLHAESPRLPAIPGQPPNPAHLPRGCTFAPRCPMAQAVCRDEPPLLRDDGTKHLSACHFADAVDSSLSFEVAPR